MDLKRALPAVAESCSPVPDNCRTPARAEHVRMLRDRLVRVQSELQSVDSRLSAKGDYGPGVGDPGIYDWEMNLARRARLRARIRSIKEALVRAKSGDYGICKECRCRIRVERLKALPFTSLCIECARRKGQPARD